MVCNRIDHDGEDYRDICGRFFGRPGRHGTRHDKDIHLQADQFGGKIGKPLRLPFRESRLDYDIAAFDIAEFGEPFPECAEEG